MPLLETLVFLCSCLHPCPCRLGFANVVDLLLECTYLHTQVEFDLFEAETCNHDSCLSEIADCVLMVDMSRRLEDGHSHTWDIQHVRISFLTEPSDFAEESGQRINGILVFQAPRGLE